ncbi:MAG TPA: DUF4838 domain-containing protein [Chthoniobacteraceae bacterium]|nr:DUF4838 domain-containing protein [Chthoniobacteraceae bacterium]
MILVRPLLITLFSFQSLVGWLHAEEFVLVDGGKPVSTIVTAENPPEATREAVRELNYWITRITGTPLPVANEKEWDGEGAWIAVGESGLTRANGWSSDALPPEGARVVIKPQKMALIGKDPLINNTSWRGVDHIERPLATGAGYAVEEFVQGTLGVRLIWPGKLGEVFRPRKTLSVKTGKHLWKPRLTHARFMYNGLGVGRMQGHMKPFLPPGDMPIKAWRAREAEVEMLFHRKRMNWAVGLAFIESELNWWERYSETHPDWFAKPPEGITQQGGHGVKLNLTHPGVYDEKIRLWKELRATRPGRYRYLNATANDSRGFCTRPESRAWDAPAMQSLSDEEIWNGDQAVLSDRYVRYWNGLAQRVREIEPEGGVTAMAYRNYRKPPLVEKITGNLYLAYVGGEGFYPDDRYLLEEWQGWREKGAKMIWRPNLFHAGHAIPYLYTRPLYHDFQALQANGMLGVEFDSIIGNWAGQGLNYYIVTELCQRPDAEYETLVSEYYSAFGPAAGAMRRYHEHFENVTAKGPELLRQHQLVRRETWGGWWYGHVHLVPLLMTPEVMARGDALLREAEAQVAAGSIEAQRVAFLRTGFEHSRLMAETFAKLGLGDPKLRLREVDKREILKPLWEMRMKLLTAHAVSVQWAFYHEQRACGIWADYLLAARREAGQRTAIVKGWEIKKDPQRQGLEGQWQKSAFASQEGWTPGEAGMPWRRALADGEGGEACPVVWYRVKFPTPDLGDMKNRVRLRFESVDAEAHIWVNGERVAERGFPHRKNYDSWKESFEVDITSAIRSGLWNEMVIRVGSESQNAGITGTVSVLTD